MPNDETDTLEMELPSAQPGGELDKGVTALVEIDVAGLSHQGLVRATNEDHFYIARADRVLQTLSTNLPRALDPRRVGESAFGMVVADGIGGSAAGEVASRLAVTTLMDQVLTTSDWIMRLDDTQAQRVQDRFRERFQQIHAAVQEAAEHATDLAGMGTTLTVACSNGRNLLIAHLGDSRVYLWRQRHLQQLTRDHTVAQEMVDAGELQSVQAARPRLRNTLTRAIGGWCGAADADVQLWKLEDGDRLLLCTDGLTDLVDDAAIAGILDQCESSAAACQALIDRALARGGKDNVTVVAARYRIPEQVG